MKASMKNLRLPEAKRLTHTVRDDRYSGQGAGIHEVRIPPKKIEGTPPSKKVLEKANAVRSEEAARKHAIVKQMALEGKRGPEIAEATGYTQKTVRTIVRNLRRQGIEIPDRKRGREKKDEKEGG